MIAEQIRKYTEKHGFERFAPEAVLFDMDGVLYDSMPTHALCWTQTMAGFGITMPEADTYAYEGMRGVEIIQREFKQQLGRDVTDEEAQRMYDLKAKLFGEHPDPPVMEGVRELMRKMKASGLTIGVVTGSGQKPLIKKLLDDFSEFVDASHLVTAYDVKHGKPAPDPYLMGLEKAGRLQPWQGIVIENAPLGVRSAVSAGLFTIAVNSGPLPDSELTDSGSDMIFPRMTALCDAWEDISTELLNNKRRG